MQKEIIKEKYDFVFRSNYVLLRTDEFPISEIQNIISLLRKNEYIDPSANYNFKIEIYLGYGDDRPELKLSWEIVS